MNYIDAYPDFIALVTWLETNGYEVEQTEEDEYTFVTVNGKGIKGAFCTPNWESYPSLNGKFAVDNVDSFNKWSTCPMVVSIPFDLGKLKEWLKFLGSDAGFNHSNEYEFYNNPIFPREIE